MQLLRLKNITRKQLIELAEVKAGSFNRQQSYNISIDDILDYLKEFKWKHRDVISMHEIVNDIFEIDEKDIYDFLATQAILESKELKIEDFEDLIEDH